MGKVEYVHSSFNYSLILPLFLGMATPDLFPREAQSGREHGVGKKGNQKARP